MENLISHSNAITKVRKPLEQKSLIRTALLIFLTATSVLSIGSCCRNASELKKVKEDNEDLKKDVEYYQKDAQELSLAKGELETYANDAYDFVSSIHPPYPTEMDGLTAIESETEMIRAGESALKNDKKARAEYDKAVKVMGFDEEERQAQLLRLQNGWVQPQR